MLIKIDDLDSKQFAGLGVYLASEANIVRDNDYIRIDGQSTLQKSNITFAKLVSSKSNGDDKQNVTIEVTTSYSKAEERQPRVLIPATYLLALLQSMEFFPNGQ